MAAATTSRQTPPTATGIDTIETGMQLLTALAQLGRPQMLKTLSEHVGMPPSRAHRYLASFAKTGFVSRDAETGRYTLGPAAIRTGLAALGGIEGVALAIDIAVGLRETFDHTAVVSIWGPRGPTIVHLEESSDSRVYVRPGTTIPLLSSSSGRAFAAALPERTFMPLLKRELKLNAQRGDDRLVSTLEQASRLIADVRRSGVAGVKDGLSLGIHALAAALCGIEGHAVAVVAVMGPRDVFDASARGDVAGLLRKLTTEASARLGHVATTQRAR